MPLLRLRLPVWRAASRVDVALKGSPPLSTLARLALGVVVSAVLGCQSALPPVADAVGSAPGLVAFASEEGLMRLSRTSDKVDFPPLANQFEAQFHAFFCGPTSAAIVLNAIRNRSTNLPRDHGRLKADDLRYVPSGYDPIVPR